MLNTRNCQHLGLLNQQIALKLVPRPLRFMMKVENVYLLVRLLWLISLVDLTLA